MNEKITCEMFIPRGQDPWYEMRTEVVLENENGLEYFNSNRMESMICDKIAREIQSRFHKLVHYDERLRPGGKVVTASIVIEIPKTEER